MSFVADTATLAHGFTMADLHRAARQAAGGSGARSPLPWDERYEIAWMAIAEAIYESDERPNLPLVGMQAISKESHSYRSFHGLEGASARDGDRAPSFIKFWAPRGSEDFTDTIVERLSLPAVLSLLSSEEYEVLAALAAHGTQLKVAEVLRLSPALVNQRVKSGRQRVIAAWIAPDTPRDISIKNRDSDTCRYGHLRSEHSFARKDGGIRCRLCERARSRRRGAAGRKGRPRAA